MIEHMQQALGWALWGNRVELYVFSAAVFLGVWIGLGLVQRILMRRLRVLAQSTATDIDDFVLSLLDRIGSSMHALIALYLATRSLALAGSVQWALQLVFVIVLTVKVIQLLQEVSGFSWRSGFLGWKRRMRRASRLRAISRRSCTSSCGWRASFSCWTTWEWTSLRCWLAWGSEALRWR